ncbi:MULTISPECIES: heavy-metal-associated domain-containing protein [unclassified Nostoc]|uniref:heavy-metal-associated domain-containing protein n=1 Tax=unclassified Nostoc TaxID=2593658 RepID=UPI0025FCFC17|nr:MULTISPECIES: heavy-metal-associated domain-containing protein [unclassified Nostoc]
MKLQLKVPKMSCGGCVNTITNAIKTVDAKATVQGDPTTKTNERHYQLRIMLTNSEGLSFIATNKQKVLQRGFRTRYKT